MTVKQSIKESNQYEEDSFQLKSLGVEPESENGQIIRELLSKISSATELSFSLQSYIATSLNQLQVAEVQSLLNVKKMVAFRLAKLMHEMHPGFKSLSSKLVKRNQVGNDLSNIVANVPALFSSSPIVAKTATYTFASTEVAAEAFKGREPTHHIYSRLMNPTSVILAIKMTELEAGKNSDDYMALNFNSGMAAIESLLSNVLQYQDILIVSRHTYGGVYQLLQDYFGDSKRLACKIEWFDGASKGEFIEFLEGVEQRYQKEIRNGKKVHVYLESPCNPHGALTDVAGISEIAHEHGLLVIADCTVATPMLYRPLSHPDKRCRPDYVVHSYTKDLSGHGNVIGGVVIGDSSRMFLPKGEKTKQVNWDETLFWDVYYIKGGFLTAEASAEVLNGLKTLELRMSKKALNTTVLTRYLASNKYLRVNSPLLSNGLQSELLSRDYLCGLPAPLFSFDFEKLELPLSIFRSFLDSLEPFFAQMVSLGQLNTIALCPAQTSHSELSEDALGLAGITETTVRLSVGCDCAFDLACHFKSVSKMFIDKEVADFSAQFMSDSELKTLIYETTMDVHEKLLQSQLEAV